jgi:hypothetical protein
MSVRNFDHAMIAALASFGFRSDMGWEEGNDPK